jgi:riboflavin biosynthesis pyrimidine reductase
MVESNGPGAPFTTLFDEQDDRDGRALPESLAAVYGRWPLPEPHADRPFTFVNFVMSHDGRVSFNEPGHMGGGDVSRRDAHDRWLMALLRARADAVLVGPSSIVAAGNHVWTSDATAPEDAAAWAELRRRESRARVPLLVVLTRSGEVPASAPGLDRPDLPVLIATTTHGESRARSILGDRSWVRYHDFGESLDQCAVMRALRHEEGVRHLLSEAGPQVYGSLVADGLIDDAFVTLSPILVGASEEQPRPSLIEGVAYPFRSPPRLRLLSVHRHGSYLYLHSRYARPTADR